MIDPRTITNYKRSEAELEEFLIFTIAVAGKNANMISRKVDAFLSLGEGECPFEVIQNLIRQRRLAWALRKVKLGKYTLLNRAFRELAASGMDLRTCSLAELELVPGVGMKTSRFFVLHSRPDQQIAVLDTHILKFLGSLGHKVPRFTPQNPRTYDLLQSAFLAEARRSGKSVADFDLEIWKRYHKPATQS